MLYLHPIRFSIVTIHQIHFSCDVLHIVHLFSDTTFSLHTIYVHVTNLTVHDFFKKHDSFLFTCRCFHVHFSYRTCGFIYHVYLSSRAVSWHAHITHIFAHENHSHLKCVRVIQRVDVYTPSYRFIMYKISLQAIHSLLLLHQWRGPPHVHQRVNAVHKNKFIFIYFAHLHSLSFEIHVMF